MDAAADKKNLAFPTSEWTTPEQKAVFAEEFAAGTRMSRLHGVPARNFRYDLDRHPLAKLVLDVLVEKSIIDRVQADGIENLGDLHRIVPREATKLDAFRFNSVSRAFYEPSDDFKQAYRRFIREVVAADVIRGPCLFQRTPNIRFHFPNQEGYVGKPDYHCDVMLGHPPQEINIWLPLCRTGGTASMRIATLDRSLALLKGVDMDFAEFAHRVQHDAATQDACDAATATVELDHGEFLAFDSRCIHATQYNDSDQTRVSVDFRVVPLEDYESTRLPYRGTGRLRMPFKRGDYFDDEIARADTH